MSLQQTEKTSQGERQPRRRRAATGRATRPAGADAPAPPVDLRASRLAIEASALRLADRPSHPIAAATGLLADVGERLGWRTGAFWSLDEEDRLDARWSWWRPDMPPIPCAALTDSRYVDAGDPLRQSVSMSAPCWLEDLDEFASPAGGERIFAARIAGLRSMLAVPVMAGGRCHGVLEWFGGKPLARDLPSLEILVALARVLGRTFHRAELHDELRRLRAIVDAMPDLVAVVDPHTLRFVHLNEAARQASGYELDVCASLRSQDILQESEESLRATYRRLAARPGQIEERELHVTSPDGVRGRVMVRRSALRVGNRDLILSVSRDITAERRAQRAVEHSARLYATLSKTNEIVLRARNRRDLYDRICRTAVEDERFVGASIVLREPDGSFPVITTAGVLHENLRGTRVTADPGHPNGRGLVGIALRTARPAIAQDFLADERTAPWHDNARRTGIAAAAAFPLVHDGGAIGVLTLYAGARDSFDDQTVRLLERMAENVAFAIDNIERDAERRRAHRQARYLTLHDVLTGLPNRAAFSASLARRIRRARRDRGKFAVLFIDLDRFRVFNEGLGHEAGDCLLREIAGRIRGCLRRSDTLARLGGDEFVVLVDDMADDDAIGGLATRILAAAAEPVEIAGQTCHVGASIGISLFPYDGLDEQALMRNADIAMDEAKARGKNTFRFFSSEARDPLPLRLTLETALRCALERGEFRLAYQPQVDLASGRITGAEALLRWGSPEHGSVPPHHFIPLAEETGLIIGIGGWVIREACAQLARMQAAGLPPLRVAVNLSARQLEDPALVEEIDAALAAAGLGGDRLEIEITESMMVARADRTRRILDRIRARGVRIAIDDFGTGYSSLGQLKRFPVDVLKIDRSFVQDLPGENGDREITRAIVAMGRSLELRVVAEGVETTGQLDYLRSIGCDEMQGFLFSKPVVAGEFERLLARHHHGAPPGSPSATLGKDPAARR